MKEPHILVVDDSADNRGLLSQLLEDEGYRVSEAANGSEALEAIAHERPDVMLLDLLMPVLDGFGVLDALKAADGPFLPVVVVTANAEPEARLHALKLGAHELLRKPIEREELLVRVRTLLELKRAKDALEERNRTLEADVARRTEELASQRSFTERLQRERIVALEQADRYKDEFLSVISHELRTPLNFIMGFASTLQDEVQGPMNPRQHDAVERILVGSERMLKLVDDLLDFAKMQAGTFQLVREEVAYAPLVRDVVSLLRPLAAKKGLVLEVDVRVPDLPCIDGERVGQVLTNLIGNAIKFTDAGTIRVLAFMENDMLVTEVTDSGCGISAEDQHKLFISFRQLDMSATRKVGGTGLGLSISKAIVLAHDGRIGVASPGPGLGSTFRFELPLVPSRVTTQAM